MSRLLDALKQRFSSPKDVLRALQLSEDLLDEMAQDRSIVGKRRRAKMAMDEEQSEGERQEETDHDRPLMRSALDKLLKKHGARDDHPMTKELRRMADLHDAGSTIPPKVETMGRKPQLRRRYRRRRKDDDRYENFREHLRQNSNMSEDEIEEAAEMARDVVRRRSANGKDRLPRNRLKGGAGGHFGGSRDKARDEIDQIEKLSQRFGDNVGMATGPNSEHARTHIIDHHMGKGANDSLSEIAKIQKLMRRFGNAEAGAAPERYRGAQDSAPDKDEARLHRMFPGLALIGDSFDGEGPGRLDGSHKNPFEVI